MLTKNLIVVQIWFSVTNPSRTLKNASGTCSNKNSLKKLNHLSGLQYHVKYESSSLLKWNRFSVFRFSSINNVPGEWLIIIVAHAGCVPMSSVSATNASSSTLGSTAASPNPSLSLSLSLLCPLSLYLSLSTDLLAQRTRPQHAQYHLRICGKVTPALVLS